MTLAALSTESVISTGDCVEEVSERLSTFFDQQESKATGYGEPYQRLWAAVRCSSEGGKKFRPALVLDTYRLLGGTDHDDAIEVAAAFELFHTAFLLHDDVIDDDSVRRGRPNLPGAFTAEAAAHGADAASASTWGAASAILAGDLLIHAAQAMVARLDIGHSRRVELIDLLDECLFVTAAGELSDVGFSTAMAIPAASEVLSMTQWKTAHYSFQAPLEAAAILAGAQSGTRHRLGELGRLTGVAFQLRDDVLASIHRCSWVLFGGLNAKCPSFRGKWSLSRAHLPLKSEHFADASFPHSVRCVSFLR